MIFAMPLSDGDCGFAATHLRLIETVIISEETNRGRVIVQFRQIKAELLNDVPRDVHDEIREVGIKETIKSPPDTVVVEALKLIFPQLK